MAEYIDREKVLDEFYQCVLDGTITSVEDTGKFLRDFPAADVVPVVHGRWIRYHEADLGWDEYGYRCSECKMEIEDKDFWDMFEKRCPNCGARMDGE